MAAAYGILTTNRISSIYDEVTRVQYDSNIFKYLKSNRYDWVEDIQILDPKKLIEGFTCSILGDYIYNTNREVNFRYILRGIKNNISWGELKNRLMDRPAKDIVDVIASNWSLKIV